MERRRGQKDACSCLMQQHNGVLGNDVTSGICNEFYSGFNEERRKKVKKRVTVILCFFD